MYRLLYLPSADKIAAEKSNVTIDRVPSSAGLSDAYTDATTDDERNELWTTAKTFVFKFIFIETICIAV